MKVEDEGKGRRDWKVIAAVATASALGLSGLALADSNDGSAVPDPIDLEDRTPITEVTVAKSTSTTLADLGITVSTLDSASSPFDDPAPVTSVAGSAASAASPEAPAPAVEASADSPAPAPAPAAEASADSPAPAPAAEVSADSAASAGSVGSSADS